MHSNRLISFWKDQTSFSIYVKGGTHIHIAYIIESSITHHNIGLIGSLFAPSLRGIITVENSAVLLATITFDLLLMICFGLLMGINRRIMVRYNLFKEGREDILDRH